MRDVFLLAVTLAITLTSSPGFSEEHYYPKPLVNNNSEYQDFPLGVLSATGRLHDGENEIRILDVGTGGIAEKVGLSVDDRIVSIQGKKAGPFRMLPDAGLDGPQRMLGMALDLMCAAKSPVLNLGIRRAGKTISYKVELPPSPKFSPLMPKKCEKSEKYIQSIARHLAATQKTDGSWEPGVGGDAGDYTAALCGMTLLASGNPEHLPTVRKALQFVRSGYIAKTDLMNSMVGPGNFVTSAAAMFLAEYHLATEDKEVLDDLAKCCDLLAIRVSQNGTMGHHYEITYNGGGLTIINVHAHLAWSLASKCGYEVKADVWNRSLGEISKSLTKQGGVGYSSRAVGDDDAPARTGGMATALTLSGQHPAEARAMGRWLEKFNNRLPMAHTNASMGLIFGTAGIKATNPEFLSRHMRNWLPYLELCRSSGEGAQYFGNKANYGGDAYLGLDPIGNATVGLMLASGQERLFLFGGKQKGWLTAIDSEKKTN